MLRVAVENQSFFTAPEVTQHNAVIDPEERKINLYVGTKSRKPIVDRSVQALHATEALAVGR